MHGVAALDGDFGTAEVRPAGQVRDARLGPKINSRTADCGPAAKKRLQQIMSLAGELESYGNAERIKIDTAAIGSAIVHIEIPLPLQPAGDRLGKIILQPQSGSAHRFIV